MPETKRLLETALATNPQNQDIMHKLAHVLVLEGKLGEARQLVEKGQDLSGNRNPESIMAPNQVTRAQGANLPTAAFLAFEESFKARVS